MNKYRTYYLTNDGKELVNNVLKLAGNVSIGIGVALVFYSMIVLSSVCFQ